MAPDLTGAGHLMKIEQLIELVEQNNHGRQDDEYCRHKSKPETFVHFAISGYLR